MICKKRYVVFTLFCFLFLPLKSILAQGKKLEKADKEYNELAFKKAAKLYEEIVENGNPSNDVYLKLGNCYYYNGNYKEAATPYSKILNTSKGLDDEYYFRYAQALNSLEKYDEAASVLKTYYSLAGKTDTSDKWKEYKRSSDIKKQSGRYNIEAVAINSEASDFGTAFYGRDKIMYTSAKDTGIVFKRKHAWNDQSFLKIYTADIDANGGLVNAAKLKGDVNTKYHQSSPVVTKDGKKMFFTRNNYINGKLGADKKGISNLKIYTADNVNGEWKNVRELASPINSNEFSSAHPALSPDEKQLYFASDRNNKFGNTDLYVVSISEGGIVGNDLTKLSDEINTPGKETFPFIDSNGILYFTSDGHPGIGGLDVFAAKKNSDGAYNVVNVGDGVNTVDDDFAYVIDNQSKRGYFSSSRNGSDDIFTFVENKPVNFDLEKKIDLVVDNQVVKVNDQDNLTSKLNLLPIYFDFNDYSIRKSSRKELNTIVDVMKNQPVITIKVNSYTDSRGKDEFNMKLSQKRADATVKYIINAGIDKDRISGEGFGETKLQNNCSNGVKCSEAEHELNRRSEFIISLK
nr:OmpA family protein [uncultured Flavobacterium sp.]